MTRAWIEPQSPGSLANTLPTRPMYVDPHKIIIQLQIELEIDLFAKVCPTKQLEVCLLHEAKLKKLYSSPLLSPLAVLLQLILLFPEQQVFMLLFD